jgi:hypothetical protein
MEKFTHIIRSICFVLFVLVTQDAIADCYWLQQGSQAICSMYLPNAKKEQTTASLAVSYDKKNDCLPVVSLIIMHGQSLGAPKRQNRFISHNDQLKIVINGKEFSDTTNATIYTNAMEYAMFGSPSLIKALSESRFILAKPGNLATFDFANDNKFLQANNLARGSCK